MNFKFLLFCGMAFAPIVLLSGCQEKKTEMAKPEAPKLSAVFQSQVMKLLEVGTKINSASSEGVSFASFNNMLEDVNGAFELCETMWPENFSTDAKTSFQQALAGWNFTRKLWGVKISDAKYDFKHGARMHEIPYEDMPDDFKALVSTEDCEWTEDDKSDKQVNYDQISLCMSYSSAKFEEARKGLLAALK